MWSSRFVGHDPDTFLGACEDFYLLFLFFGAREHALFIRTLEMKPFPKQAVGFLGTHPLCCAWLQGSLGERKDGTYRQDVFAFLSYRFWKECHCLQSSPGTWYPSRKLPSSGVSTSSHSGRTVWPSLSRCCPPPATLSPGSTKFGRQQPGGHRRPAESPYV